MNELSQAIDEAISDGLNQLTGADRQRLADHLFTWISFTAVKKPVPDLAERISRMRKRFDELAEQISLGWRDGDFVVKTTGDSEFTLLGLERGTDWFEAYEGVRDSIVAVLLGESGI